MLQPYRIVIVGGGTAGWMTAAAISALYKDQTRYHIVLIESDEIGSVGVGEATLPQLKSFNEQLGIVEADMMKATSATFKLGIKFANWGKVGESYIHPFGLSGGPKNTLEFHQYWAHFRSSNTIPDLSEYSLAVHLCQKNKFKIPSKDPESIENTYSYAYHFDATLYAQYLRKISEKYGVHRINGIVTRVTQNDETGEIRAVHLKDGTEIIGDFFIDCSGFRSLLLNKKLKAEFEDWSDWLPCDSALAVQSVKDEDTPPYTTSTAKEAGWQWRIPLQHRTGNGYVFCSSVISETEAYDSLMKDIKGVAQTDPKLIKFKAGRYKNSWKKNCVAIGLSSGFLEPLESTSIYLIQIAIVCLLRLFPTKVDKRNTILADEYNRLIDNEYERIRDFLILHYHLNERSDSDLWRHCREMAIPDSLTQKLDMFERRGYTESFKYGLFSAPSWLAVLYGQGLSQKGVDPFISSISKNNIEPIFGDVEQKIQQAISTAYNHKEFLSNYCPSII